MDSSLGSWSGTTRATSPEGCWVARATLPWRRAGRHLNYAKKKKKKKGGKRWLPRHVNYWRWCRRGVKSMAASGVLGPSYPAARVIASWQASCAAKQRNCVGVGEGNRASVLVSFPFIRMASVIFTLNWGDHLFFQFSQPWRERGLLPEAFCLQVFSC